MVINTLFYGIPFIINMKQKIIDGFSYIKSSRTRKKILLALDENILIPSEISKVTNVSPAHISRALKQLQENNLIICLNPEKRVGKLFITTELGKSVLNCVKKYMINK